MLLCNREGFFLLHIRHLEPHEIGDVEKWFSSSVVAFPGQLFSTLSVCMYNSKILKCVWKSNFRIFQVPVGV